MEEVDPEVRNRKEAQEKETTSSDPQILLKEDHNTTTPLAQMSPQSPSTPLPNPSSSSSSVKRKSLKVTVKLPGVVEKSHFASKPSNAVSGYAGKRSSCRKEKIAIHTLGQAKSSTMIRAEEFQSNLGSEFPSFVKSMVRSQVTIGFWMGLPLAFCKSYLPRKDTMVKLEDEHGGTYEARFLAEKTGLSAGWKQFSVIHKLLEGDVLVFQLVEPSKFKVYIIRENDLTEEDGALTLVNLDAHTKENDQVDDAAMGAVACNNMKRKGRPKSLPLAIVQKKIKRTGICRLPKSARKLGKKTEQIENDSENVGSEVLDDSRLPEMEFDEEVQKEGEEKEMPLSDPSQDISQEEDYRTPAIIRSTFAPTPEPNPYSTDKQKSKVENETLLQVKMSRSASRPRNATYEQARKCICCTAKKAAIHTPGQAKSSAMIQAEEVHSNLDSKFPSFIKSMVRSHVSSCFWMGLPGPFCKSHLPRKETTVTLIDERGGTYEVKFMPEKTGLSGGWKLFSVEHNLLEGDVLVFQLIEPLKFKVYIVRANDLTEVDGALNLLNLDVLAKQNDQEIGADACTSVKRKNHPKSLPLSVVKKKNKKKGLRCLPRTGLKIGNPMEHSENDGENVGSEVLEGSRFPGFAVPFKDILNYDNFHIMVNGLLVDSELSDDIRSKYYKLCCSQNAFLHDHLVKGLNVKLISGIISETVNISEAVRACKLTICWDEFAIWDQTLKALEVFGMNISFIRARLNRLISLALESDGAMDRKKYMEAQTEQSHREDEIRNLEAKLVELKDVSARFVADVETLKSKVERYELKFHEEVSAPW